MRGMAIPRIPRRAELKFRVPPYSALGCSGRDPRPNYLVSVNEVYYQNSAGNMGEGDIEPGTDFDELRAVGVNTLSAGFYNPGRLMDAEYVSYGNSSFNDDAGLAGLAKNWQGALGEEWGMFLVSIGGMTAKKEDFESAFADGAKLGAAYGTVLASLREKSGAKSMQIGLDIDVEGPCDKDKQCGQ